MSDLNQNQPENNEPVPSILGQPTEPTEPNEPTAPVDQPEVIGSIDDYKVEIDGFNFDEFKEIEENKAFLERAKEAGIDNKALSFALKEYSDLIPSLMQNNAQLDNESCVAEMKQTWGADADSNFKAAQTAANHLINNGVLTAEEINNPSFGNNPLVLKMAAYLGQQLNEDTPPSNTQQSGGLDVESLMHSEAYLNESHPDHKRVFAQVQGFYQKQYKG